jgi:glycosyltransferase involved in cell wall biosynthesis
MATKGLRLGIYINHTHLGDGRYTVTNSDALTFIEHLKLAKHYTLAVSVVPVQDINPEDYSVVLEQRNVTSLPLPAWKSIVGSLPSMAFSFRKLLKIARRLVENSDLIWLRIPSLVALFFWWVAKKTKKPLIVHVIGNPLLAPRRPKYKGLRKAVIYVFSYALFFIVKIMTRYGLIMTAGGELQELLSTPLHTAFQLDDVLIYQKDLRPAKKPSEHTKEILFVGRFDYGKGMEILIDSIGELKEEFPDIRLKMAGTGVLLDAMRERVAARGLDRNVKLLGFVSPYGPLQELYRKSDISVIPSDGSEGFPRVILETWAAGLPLIATRLSGIPYRVRDGENGLLVTPGDREELVNALRRLISDADLRYRIAQGGVRTVESLTFEHQSNRLRKLLTSYYPNLRLVPNVKLLA